MNIKDSATIDTAQSQKLGKIIEAKWVIWGRYERLGMRRFTRLTNAFSNKLENLEHNLTLYFMHYNFCRIHQTLRLTPAIEAGIADHVWSLEEIVALLP